MTNDKPVFWVGGRAQDGQGNDVDVPETTEQASADAETTELEGLRAQLNEVTLERDRAEEKNGELHEELYSVLGGEAAIASGKSPARLALEMRDALEGIIKQVEQENSDLKGQLKTLTAESEDALKRAQADAAELVILREQVETLTAERDQLQTALEDLQTAPAGLPADAHARLVGVKGVGEKLADEIMAALTAPAPAQAE